jgi:hypothetical protein
MRVALVEQTAVRDGTLVEDATGMSRAKPVTIIVCLSAGLLGSGLIASAGQEAPVPLAERARGAELVIVGRVARVESVWQINEFGDRLIVSIVRVAVNETLKGQASQTLDVEVEGGTIGELSLHVSDQTSFSPGDRAVFYLKRNARGALVPHLRGQGLLKLDVSDRVPGSSLTLGEIRRQVAAGN